MLYFNYAGLSPARPEVVRTMQHATDTFRGLLFSESGISWYRKQEEECSKQVAALLDVSLQGTEHSVLLCPNSTSAYRIVLSMLNLQPGDVVITTDQEHPSTFQALDALAAQGIHLHVIPARTPQEFLSLLDEACRIPHAKVLSISHVTHADGRLFPLKQMCDIAGQRALVVVIDGAQAVGQVPVALDASKLDFYFFSGHKWCAGPMGTGALLMTERFKWRTPRREKSRFTHEQPIHDLHLGTQDIAQIAGLGLACQLKREEWSAMQRLAEIRKLLSDSLAPIPGIEIAGWEGEHAPGILSFRSQNPDVEPARIARYLSTQADIAIKAIDYPGLPSMLRASWSLQTQPRDIHVLVQQVRRALVISAL